MYIKRTNCKWCGLLFDGTINVPNHSRWCNKNPAKDAYLDTLSKNRSNITAETVKKQVAATTQAHANGRYIDAQQNLIGKPGTRHSPESKQLMREKALASPHRRLVRSTKDYIKKDGSVVKLDSSWEVALANRLEDLNVNWIRPDPIKWVDDAGVYHNYFPDFYLNDYDLYLDPKGPYAVKAQQSKIKCLTGQLKNLIIITTLIECKNFTP